MVSILLISKRGIRLRSTVVIKKSAKTTCTLPSETLCATFTYLTSAATASIVACILIDLSVRGVMQIATHVLYRSVAHRATPMWLSIDKSHPRDRIVVVVRVLVPALYQLLLCLFKP